MVHKLSSWCANCHNGAQTVIMVHKQLFAGVLLEIIEPTGMSNYYTYSTTTTAVTYKCPFMVKLVEINYAYAHSSKF